MNFRILSKILGALLLLVSAAMGACGLFSLLDSVPAKGQATQALFVSSAVTAMAGLILMLCGPGKIHKFPRREGLCIVGLGWILSGVFGAIPFILSEPGLAPAAAVFESVSGFTTTGSTVMADIEAWPRGILLWRSVTQWLGGLGILVLFVAVLSYFGLGGKSLFRNESSFKTGEASTARIRDTATLLWKLYVTFTGICALGLKAMGLTWYNAILHSMTSLATGGFSPHNSSVGHYSDWGNGWLIELWLILFMTIGSINFLIWALIIKGRWKRLRDEEEGKWFIGICLFIAIFIAVQLHQAQQYESFWRALRDSLFTLVSIASTTGFGTVDYSVWPAFSLISLIILMVIGGCAGSTSGGIKMSRMLIFVKSMRQQVTRSFRPQKVLRMKVNGSQIDNETRDQVVVFVGLYLFLIALSAIIISLMESSAGVTMDTAFGAVLATLPNIGPGLGDVGPMSNFGWLKAETQVFLSLLMVMGRLELYAILALFVPALWKKY